MPIDVAMSDLYDIQDYHVPDVVCLVRQLPCSAVYAYSMYSVPPYSAYSITMCPLYDIQLPCTPL